MKRLPAVLVVAVACGACGSSSPSAPTQTTTTVTLQSVGLSAAFSSLKLRGQSTPIIATGTFSNSTTSVVTTSCVNWQSDNTAVLTVDQGGLMTAQGSGGATVTTTCQNVSARGLATLSLLPDQLFTRSGSGNTVFDMPTYVTRVHVTADYSGSCQNFIVHIGGRSIANEILGSCSVNTTGRHYDAIALTTGGVVEIIDSSGVSWSFTEVRQ